jgi:hypothetical protein
VWCVDLGSAASRTARKLDRASSAGFTLRTGDVGHDDVGDSGPDDAGEAVGEAAAEAPPARSEAVEADPRRPAEAARGVRWTRDARELTVTENGSAGAIARRSVTDAVPAPLNDDDPPARAMSPFTTNNGNRICARWATDVRCD